jgi:hypothetical protein
MSSSTCALWSQNEYQHLCTVESDSVLVHVHYRVRQCNSALWGWTVYRFMCPSESDLVPVKVHYVHCVGGLGAVACALWRVDCVSVQGGAGYQYMCTSNPRLSISTCALWSQTEYQYMCTSNPRLSISTCALWSQIVYQYMCTVESD